MTGKRLDWLGFCESFPLPEAGFDPPRHLPPEPSICGPSGTGECTPGSSKMRQTAEQGRQALRLRPPWLGARRRRHCAGQIGGNNRRLTTDCRPLPRRTRSGTYSKMLNPHVLARLGTCGFAGCESNVEPFARFSAEPRRSLCASHVRVRAERSRRRSDLALLDGPLRRRRRAHNHRLAS